MRLELRDNALVGVRVEGHAQITQAGISAVCAAVSGVVRSAAEAIAAHDIAAAPERKLGVEGTLPAEGVLELSIDKPEADLSWLHGVTDTLRAGVYRMAQEFPQEVRLEVTKGEQHGS